MDTNNNLWGKLDCEVTDNDKKGEHHTRCTLTDNNYTSCLDVKLSEHGSFVNILEESKTRETLLGRSSILQESADEIGTKLEQERTREIAGFKKCGRVRDNRESYKEELKGTPVADKGSCQGSLELEGDVVDFGMTRGHDMTFLVQGEEARLLGRQDSRKKKLKKRQAIKKMLDGNENVWDSFGEHMVDLADQAEQDNWFKSASVKCYDENEKPQKQNTDMTDSSERKCEKCAYSCFQSSEYRNQNANATANGDNIHSGISKKKTKSLQEKSKSSNSLLTKKPEKLDVTIPKVKIEQSAHIVEARPKSHHFLWTIPDPGSQKLNWHKPPLTVLVVKKIYDESVLTPFKDLVKWLIEVRKMIVYVESNVLEDGILANDSSFLKYKGKLQTFREAKDDLTDKIDFIICLGGDGTLLHASTLFQESCPPVMAFHQGSLGFLTPFSFDNFESQVEQVLDGNASLLLRYRLKCVICKEDSELGRVSRIKNIDKFSLCEKSQILVLNEVVVDRGSSSFICNIDVYVEDRLVTSVQGDGIIISTPTGSTAYAVAAGASMIHPNVPAIMITPICPHSLSFRPIVVPAGVELKLMLSPDARNNAMVSFDGRNRQEICKGDSVRITTAQYPLPAVCAKDQIEDWFDRLAECLHWNVRKPQKMLDSSRNTSDSSITTNDVFTEEQNS